MPDHVGLFLFGYGHEREKACAQAEAIGTLDPSGAYAISVVTSALPTLPVPEALSFAMLLGGLGLPGFMRCRRLAK